ncbi:hypothetical protein OG21DRAFT_337711 [Imleria badia]|nr:hypothetical protein OG21DRAFT_337711 [Imleria badia]
MATSNAALPAMAKISMIGIWVETVLYGACVMYGLSMFVLLRGGKIATLRWMLVVMSTILFLLCSTHVGASLQQLLDAFIYAPPDVPNYSTVYWLNFNATPCVLKNILYGTLVLAQQVILIWRLYVVFMHDWRVVVLPIISTAGCVGSAYAASAVATRPNYGLPATNDLLLSAWAFGFILNVSVTLAIAGRLWWMGRRIGSLTSTSTGFVSSIYVVVESGALSAVANTVVLALYANPAALTGLDIASQLVTLAPLSIVVQVGLTGRYHVPSGGSSKAIPIAQDKVIFRVGSPREEDSRNDLALHAVLSRSKPSSAHNDHV